MDDVWGLAAVQEQIHRSQFDLIGERVHVTKTPEPAPPPVEPAPEPAPDLVPIVKTKVHGALERAWDVFLGADADAGRMPRPVLEALLQLRDWSRQ